MKTTTKATVALLALGVSAWVIAQDFNGAPPNGPRPPHREGFGPQGPGPNGPRGPGGPGREGQRPLPHPIVAVLDANHDGVIDETELANASAALAKLDRNGDGKLTMEEFRPPRPEGMGPGSRDGQGGPGGSGFDGPRGPRGPGGPGGPNGPRDSRRPQGSDDGLPPMN